MTGRSDLGPAGGDRWSGLVLEVAGPRRPGLRVEVTAGRRLLVRQGGRVVLLGRCADDHGGVEFLRTGAYRSPVAPLRADTARGVTGPADSWYPRWAHRFAGTLTTAAEGPLHTGRWLLARGPAGPVVDGDPGGWIDWFASSGGGMLPLRRLSTPDAGRVAAHRKLAREGILPPVLLWWVSGLGCHLILDGHDRLVAALAEGVEPPLLTIGAGLTHDRIEQRLDCDVRRHAATGEHLRRQITAGTPGAMAASASLDRWLAGAHVSVRATYGPTRAWLIRGGAAAWQRVFNETAGRAPLPTDRTGVVDGR